MGEHGKRRVQVLYPCATGACAFDARMCALADQPGMHDAQGLTHSNTRSDTYCLAVLQEGRTPGPLALRL